MSYAIDSTVQGVDPKIAQTVREGYARYICDTLRSGYNCHIYNVAQVYGGSPKDSYETFAYQQYMVAEQLGIDYEVVHRVLGSLLTRYLQSFIENGNVSFDNLVRLRNDNGKVRSEISTYARKYCTDSMRCYPTAHFKSLVQKLSK